MSPTRSPLHRGRRTRGLLAATGIAAVGAAAAFTPALAPASDTSVTAAPANSRPVLASAPSPASIDSPPLSERLAVRAAADGETREAPEPEPEPEPEPAEPARSVWDRLADCESGEWTGSGGFVEGSATWTATAGLFEGGLQFHPDTWDGFKDPGMPGAAYEASRAQQIAVAERVLDAQGWKAWPVCSRKLGLR